MQLTAAYYGLYGDQIFEDYEETFLLFTRSLERSCSPSFIPTCWFSYATRTDKAATDYYKAKIFGESTFADMHREDAPYIVINATDISNS